MATLTELGRLRDASAAGEDGVELARLAGNPRMLLWAHSALAAARLAARDVAGALHHAGEAARLDARGDFHAAGQPGWRLGTALTAAGNPDRGIAELLRAFGGSEPPDVLPVDRPVAAADLVAAQLAHGDLAAAEDALAHGEAAARAAAPWAARSPASRAALAALVDAESTLDRFGAQRLRSDATRELRCLGHRVVRPTRNPHDGGPLSARARDRPAHRRRADEPRGRRAARPQHPYDRGTCAPSTPSSASAPRLELARELQRTAGSDGE